MKAAIAGASHLNPTKLSQEHGKLIKSGPWQENFTTVFSDPN
jgi:hypothetical protein